MTNFRAVCFAMVFVAQAASGQELQTQPSAPDRVPPSAPDNAERNANAPKAPALEQEPHGSGSVYQELDELRRQNKPKEQGG